jgi:N-acetylmuramoyl-L-alanine amidase
VFASCASQQNDGYDTANPYGTADAGQINPPADAAPANPIYDTPAAYEESTGVATAAPAPGVPADPAATGLAPTPAAPPAVPGNGAALIHTVEKGDTLSGLSTKYNVPIASIKAANRMTNDIVVLGRKMVIPPQ